MTPQAQALPLPLVGRGEGWGAPFTAPSAAIPPSLSLPHKGGREAPLPARPAPADLASVAQAA